MSSNSVELCFFSIENDSLRFFSEEFRVFGMNDPTFEDLDAVNADILRIKNLWGIYEEFQDELAVLGEEDWITFRTKMYRFDEFLSQWQERLKKIAEDEATKSSRKSSTKSMNARIHEDIENYRQMAPLFKWVRGESLTADHWLEMFRILKMPRSVTLEKLTFGDILKVKDEIVSNAEQLKV